jgi:RNA polymerase sigma factor (sigma-70 family)
MARRKTNGMNASPDQQRGSFGHGQFPPTLWSVVLAAGENGSVRAREALETLCRSYWYPLYAFARRLGKTAHDAEDLTQGFFQRLLEREGLAKAAPEGGRFRSFLLASLKNFIWDEWDKSRAVKRGGGQVLVSFDDLNAEERYRTEPIDPAEPEKLFERSWAMLLIDRVLVRLEKEFVANGKGERFEALHPFLLNEPAAGSYASVAQSLAMSTGAVKVAVLRLRERYRELIRLEIAETLVEGGDVEEEVRHLMSALSG